MNININPEGYASQSADVEVCGDIREWTKVYISREKTGSRKVPWISRLRKEVFSQNRRELDVSIADVSRSSDAPFARVQLNRETELLGQLHPRPGWELLKRILLDMDPSLKDTEPRKAREEFKKLCQQIARGLNEPWDEILRKSRGRE